MNHSQKFAERLRDHPGDWDACDEHEISYLKGDVCHYCAIEDEVEAEPSWMETSDE